MDFGKTPGAEREVEEAFQNAVRRLASAGLAIEAAALPDFPASDVATVVLNAEAISSFEPFYRNGGVRRLRDPYAPYQPEIASLITGADYVKAFRMRNVLLTKTAEFFDRYDVVVTPNFLSVAPPIDRDLYETLPYPDPVGAVGNACGLPSVALPCGLGAGRMPVGFQIMGAPFEEGLLLDLAETYQSQTDFHRARPPV
jgi:aspartyl-tRNA(Asn)/glutamyl-tRNA(Gln) amidotransferase subunit A